jgi:hypothetical protein
MNVLEINKGPKGIVILDFNFLSINRINDIKLPDREAINNIKTISMGPPINNPNARHNFTSPPPIHLPLDI